MNENKLALFLLLGQTARKKIAKVEEVAPNEPLMVSDTFDLASILPAEVKSAIHVSTAYKLFFIFENFVRQVILETLSEENHTDWWSKVPSDVQAEVQRLEETEEEKQWMALSPRSKLALATLPQLLKIIDDKDNWKNHFEILVRDKSLIQEARHICHIRNTVCHMSDVSDEEIARVRQVMRDWFRVISP